MVTIGVIQVRFSERINVFRETRQRDPEVTDEEGKESNTSSVDDPNLDRSTLRDFFDFVIGEQEEEDG